MTGECLPVQIIDGAENAGKALCEPKDSLVGGGRGH